MIKLMRERGVRRSLEGKSERKERQRTRMRKTDSEEENWRD